MNNDDIKKIMSGAAPGQSEASSSVPSKVDKFFNTPFGAKDAAFMPEYPAADQMAQSLAQSEEAKNVAAFTQAVGYPYTPEGLVEASTKATNEGQAMLRGLRAGDFKAASKPAVDMAMNMAMGTIGGGNPAAKGLPSRFSIFTAENPNAVKLSPKQNKILLDKLKKELTESGIPFQEAMGNYSKNAENSILIPHNDQINASFINKLGKKYNQESVIHHEEGKNRLRYVSGPKEGYSVRGEGIMEAPNAETDFTLIGGKKYQLGLDFSKEHPEMLVHYSRSESPLASIDPAFEGTGATGREQLRPDRIKRSNYYELGAEPEAVVLGGARSKYLVERPENILDIGSEEARPLFERAEQMVRQEMGLPDYAPTPQSELGTQFEKLAAQSGYAGIKNSVGPNPNHVALFEAATPVKSEVLGAAKQAAQTKPAFYHKAEQIAAQKMGGSATPEQIRGMLKEVKPEELEHLGIEDFLKGKQKVSKQELLDHIAENRLELGEVVKGQPTSEELARVKRWEELSGKRARNELAPHEVSEWYQLGGANPPIKNQTKYSEYQLPGGENYREVLFTLPAKAGELNKAFDDWALKKYGDAWLDMDAAEVRKAGEEFKRIAGNEVELRNPSYRSPHWNEPNVLAHTRVNDRNIDGKKTLFIEEIQSDWHQAGRKKGYKGVDKPKTDSYLSSAQHYDALNSLSHERFGVEYNRLSGISQRELRRELLEQGVDQVPNAPLKKTWHENVFKRMVREAAEKGYDQVAWTSGAIQNARYPAGGETGEKIASGMEGFYDKILPEYGNKFGKKYGAKVELSKLGKDAVHVMKITPELRKAALEEGFTMFANGGMATTSNQSAALKEKYGKNKINYVGYADGGDVQLPELSDIENQFQAQTAGQSPFVRSAPDMGLPVQSKQMPATVNVRNLEGNIVSIPSEQYQEALAEGYQPVSREELVAHFEQERFTGTGQKVLAGVEGLAEGLLGPIATGAEEGLSRLGVPGISAEERVKRAEYNPYTRGTAEAVGFIAPAIASLGSSAALKGAAKFTQAGLIGTAEKAAAKQLGLKAEAGFVNQLGEQAIKGAFGATLYQGGKEISAAFNQDPNQTAQSAIANIGMAGILGGVFGGAFGAAATGLKKAATIAPEFEGKFVSELDRPALEAGNLEAIVKNSNAITEKEREGILASLNRKKKDAPEIEEAAKRLGAPVLEGMVADSQLVQKAEDALINGPGTYSGIKRKELYNTAYNIANSAVEGALGDGSRLTKAELGNTLKDALSKRLRVQSSPIEEMYNLIKNDYEVISVEKGAIEGIKNELSGMKELTLSPKSPEAQMLKRVVEEVDNLKTVDDLKQYKSILTRSVSPTASSGEKRIVGIISDRLAQAEEESVTRMAKALGASDPSKAQQVASLLDQRKLANTLYKDFIKDVKQLSEQLGKGRVYGLQDALHFINERLTPEEVATRLFAKKDSEFLNFFAKKFPEEMQLIRDYQKGALREAASAQGTFSPLKLFNQVNKLEPEIQGHVFSKQELSTLKDAEKYLRAFPKNFNPSGTANMQAFRQFFEHPTGAAIANVRDVGIEAFIKMASMSPEMSNASKLAESTVKGWKAMQKASKAIFTPGQEAALPSNVINLASHRDKLMKLVDTYSQEPAKLLDMNDNNPVPEYASAFSMTGLRAVEYLNSIKPRQERLGIMDKPLPLSSDQKTAYERQVSNVQQPLMVMQHIKDGTLIPEDVQTIKAVYPELYGQMVQQLTNAMIEASAKNHIVPFATRQTLSLFLGTPLDAALTPQGIMSAQPKPQEAPQQAPQGGGLKTKKASINKMPQGYQTGLQSREAHRQKP